jgi:hypothetical protein
MLCVERIIKFMFSKIKSFENTIRKIKRPLALNNYKSSELNFLDISFI